MKKIYIAAAAAAALSLLVNMTAFAGTSAALYDANGLDINSVAVPDNASVMVVLGEDASADNGTLSVYTRTVTAAASQTEEEAAAMDGTDTVTTSVSAQAADRTVTVVGGSSIGPGAVISTDGYEGSEAAGSGIQEETGGTDYICSDWTLVLTTDAVSGENGLYKTVEGDKKTPVGIFKMNTPFGIQPALEGFPDNYLQVTDSHYWNGDSGSELYNTLVDINTYSDFSTGASEHIVDYGEYYNYCIDIGYNPEGTAHLGSAIYLHCRVAGDDDTSGCVAIPEQDMIEIMKLYDEGNTYMVIYDKADMEAVYAD